MTAVPVIGKKLPSKVTIPLFRAITDVEIDPSTQQWKIYVDDRYMRLRQIKLDRFVEMLTRFGLEVVSTQSGLLRKKQVEIPLTEIMRNPDLAKIKRHETVGYSLITIKIPANFKGDQEDPLGSFINQRIDEYRRLNTPRHLTKDEVEEIATAIPRIRSSFKEVGEVAHQEIVARVRDQISDPRVKVSPLGLADFKDAIITRFEMSQAEMAGAVGITVAEALSALTQASLNAVHTIGARFNIAMGIEMLQDLLAVRAERKAESCSVHFHDKNLSFEEIVAKRTTLVGVNVGDSRSSGSLGIVVDYDIDAPENYEPKWWLTMYPALTGRKIPKTSSVLMLKLNKTLMYAHEITMEDVVEAIEGYNTPSVVTVIASPFEEATVFIYPDEDLVLEPLKKKQVPMGGRTRAKQPISASETFISEILLPTLSRIPIKGIVGIVGIEPISAATWSLVSTVSRVILDPDQAEKETDKRTWQLQLSSFVRNRQGITAYKLGLLLRLLDFDILEATEDYMIIVSPNEQHPGDYVNARVAQADAIVDKRRSDRIAAERKARTTARSGGEVTQAEQEIRDINYDIVVASRYIYAATIGSNLAALFSRRDVDTTTTMSNNPNVTLKMLGIEATRNLLIQEFTSTLEGANMSLDPRHISLLTDFMTNRGILLPISFWGIARQNPGPLTVGAVGKAVLAYSEGALHGQSEKIRTITSATHVGRVPNVGSGSVQFNEKSIRELEQEWDRLEKEGVATVSAQDIDVAIDQMEALTFGTADEETDVLAALTARRPARLPEATPPLPPTQQGDATMAPPEIEAAPTVRSHLIDAVLPTITTATPIDEVPTEVEVTVEAVPAPTARRVIPRSIPKPVARISQRKPVAPIRGITKPTL